MQSSSEVKQPLLSQHVPSSTDSTSIEESKNQGWLVRHSIMHPQLTSFKKKGARSKPAKKSSKPCSLKVSYQKHTVAA